MKDSPANNAMNAPDFASLRPRVMAGVRRTSVAGFRCGSAWSECGAVPYAPGVCWVWTAINWLAGHAQFSGRPV